VVEFVLVSTLVVAVVLALVQLSFALLVRNTLVAAATEGARFGAFQGSTPDDGAAHTRQLLDMTLPSSYADDVTAGYEDVGGVPTVVVRVHAALPLIAWWGPAETLTAQGHAVVEQP
jgi:Flp pilus assembly protein TadG